MGYISKSIIDGTNRIPRGRSLQKGAMRVWVDVTLGVVMMLVLSIVVYRCAMEGCGFANQANCDDTANDRSKNVMPSLSREGVVCSREIIANAKLEMSQPVSVGEDSLNALSERVGDDEKGAAQLASDKNQIMDALLDQPQIPSDYADVMIGLYRDKSQDVMTRDFAVQHIGHYALALNRRGQYDADSAEARELRAALFDAAAETHSIVAAAAFRALADVSEFDSSIDARRLDSLLVACAADAAAEPAPRAMAIHLCGERRISSARQTLAAIIADPGSPEGAQRLSAEGGSTRGAGCPRTAGRASRSGQQL